MSRMPVFKLNNVSFMFNDGSLQLHNVANKAMVHWPSMDASPLVRSYEKAEARVRKILAEEREDYTEGWDLVGVLVAVPRGPFVGRIMWAEPAEVPEADGE